MSRDIPVIFSAPMVRALLDGRKTMTRRLAWRTRWNDGGVIHDGAGGQMDVVEPHEERIGPSPWQKVKPGDRLWVRESIWWHDVGQWRYGADKAPVLGRGKSVATSKPSVGKSIPSIHMPRWASRLTLVVTATKIERLQDISPADAVREGLRHHFIKETGENFYGVEDARGQFDPALASDAGPREAFARIWKSLHGDDSWHANPEVVALTFTVHQQNIDSMKVAA